jgi:hypothetical protein
MLLSDLHQQKAYLEVLRSTLEKYSYFVSMQAMMLSLLKQWVLANQKLKLTKLLTSLFMLYHLEVVMVFKGRKRE